MPGGGGQGGGISEPCYRGDLARTWPGVCAGASADWLCTHGVSVCLCMCICVPYVHVTVHGCMFCVHVCLCMCTCVGIAPVKGP